MDNIALDLETIQHSLTTIRDIIRDTIDDCETNDKQDIFDTFEKVYLMADYITVFADKIEVIYRKL